MNFDFSKIGAAFSLGKAVLEAGQKAYKSHGEKAEDERMQAVVDELRLRVLTGGGNCITATVGSEEDRFFSKMVAKGLLVRHMMNGYMLPESFNGFRGGLYS
jgi:histidinol-phosphate/aromatic aminotransferase/cobyric acid decarboxylase-like protein